MISIGRTRIVMTKTLQRVLARETPKTLNQAGDYVRRVARSLIRHRKNPNVSSAPGVAPHSHSNTAKANPGFKRTIVHAMDGRDTVLIGPQYVKGGLSNIARIHEFGGSQRVKDIPPGLEDGVNIGDVAPVTINHVSKRKDQVIRQDTHNDPKTGRKVVWIKIRTKTQAAHSNRLYSRMSKKYGKKVTAYYPARPYMRPALGLSRPKLSRFWRATIKQ
jgi:hypothetical protein